MKPTHLITLIVSLFFLGHISAQDVAAISDVEVITQPETVSTYIAPMEFIVLDQEAVPTNYPEVVEQIAYDEVSHNSGQEGKVQVRILVDAYGQYQDHFWPNGQNELLKQLVTPVLPSLEFQPAQLSGFPTESWVSLSFDFRQKN
ncbi:MAG: hypothetical protein AAGI38_21845 [Bacteroidota bacterium]